jgi:DNA-3-methyladenine glycosylase
MAKVRQNSGPQGHNVRELETMDRNGEVLHLLREDVLQGARALLGMDLVCGPLRARLVEVEAYRTPDDPACHAHRGLTRRNEAMFGEPGHAYVFFNYGVHWMLNVTAHRSGDAAAVLVRSAMPICGQAEMAANRPKARRPEDLLSGPGKLAAAFGINHGQNGWNLFDPKSDLRLESGPAPQRILETRRVGLRVGNDHQWRFTDADALRWVSSPIPRPPAR